MIQPVSKVTRLVQRASPPPGFNIKKSLKVKTETYAASFLQLGTHIQVFENNVCIKDIRQSKILSSFSLHTELSYIQNFMYQL